MGSWFLKTTHVAARKKDTLIKNFKVLYCFRKVIRKLVEAGQYDIRTLLSDESRDEFDAKKKDAYPYGYGPNSLPHVDQISLVDEGLFNKDYNNKFHNKFNHGKRKHWYPSAWVAPWFQ